MEKFNKYLFLIPLIIVVLVKFPHLRLPYFWDEAWSYFPAIKKMATTGPDLLPGAIPLELSKGHPLFFIFLASNWMKISGGSIFAMRLFTLSISIILLMTVYFNLKKIFNLNTAITAVFLISMQSLFLAQSSLLLPEMLLALFLVCSFFAFYRHRYAQYTVYASLMVLTKETGLIFAVVFGIVFLHNYLLKRNKKRPFPWKSLLMMTTPGLVYGLFLLLHYQQFHTFFYNEHLGYINLSLPALKTKFNAAVSVIFVQNGRLLISLIFLISISLLLVKSRKINENAAFIWIITSQIVAFVLFSIFNFFTLRYMIGLIILFIISVAVIIGQISINKSIKTSAIILVGLTCLYYSLTHKKNSDADLGYVEVVKLHEEMVHFCEKNNYFDSPIAASFNLIFALKDQDLGYKETQKPFTNVMDWKHVQEATVFVYESTFDENDASVKYAKENFILIKSSQHKHAWGYIYADTLPE